METVEVARSRKVVEGEEDRISALGDCLLIEILSRLLSTEDAIRTGTLSKRWQHLWASVPTLIFSYSDTPSRYFPNPKSRSDFVSFVDKTLTQRPQLKLKKFKVCSDYDSRFERQFKSWIRYAISCNVEELDLELKFRYMDEAVFVLDQFVYISSCFTDLRLSSCVLNPTGEINWKNLKSLCIKYAKLDEALIQNILSGSPQLETLELGLCYGYSRLDITSKSVKNLVFAGYKDPEHYCDMICDSIIEMNAPNILSLTIKDELYVRKLSLVNVSSLVEATLDYDPGYDEPTHKKAQELMLEEFILELRHVKEVTITYFCSQALYRLKGRGRGFDCPSNIKCPEGIHYDSNYDTDGWGAGSQSDSNYDSDGW